MDGVITQLGVGGIFAILLIEKVLGYLAKRNNGPPSRKKQPCVQTNAFVEHIRETHDTNKGIGRIEEALIILAAEAKEQTVLLRVIAQNGRKK